MSIKNNNLYEINENIQPGQKVIRFSKNVWIPVGFNTSGSNTPVPVEGAEVQLGVVDENGKFQLLSFEGTSSVESGDP
ncbi:MAG: hypothetical protein IKP65_04720 [Alphaproteobacteria bacterium]|nr:hypothetical protein [Alphaproteobacteria bacterium]